MPMFVDAAENAGLDAVAALATHASLHSAYSASGANELTGGSPAYARQAIAWDTAASGQLLLTGTEVFDVPAAATVAWVGLWSASSGGTFYGMVPAVGASGATPHPFTATTADVLTSPGHGLSDGQRVVLLAGQGTLPTGVTEGTLYWVVSTSGDTFSVSATEGGSAVDLTAAGSGAVQRAVVETFADQGTYTVSEVTVTASS
jgi:hypothetical protein